MSIDMESTPTVVVKKKQIQLLLDYCLENKFDFSVSPQATGDDFEVSFKLTDFNMAIALGMCLRDLKLELASLNNIVSVKDLKASQKEEKKAAKETTTKSTSKSTATEEKDEDMGFEFDENELKFELENN